MLKLAPEEQAWLDAYRKALEEGHPGIVEQMLFYGSKARGQAHAESELDVLLVVKNEAGQLNRLRKNSPFTLRRTQGEWRRP